MFKDIKKQLLTFAQLEPNLQLRALAIGYANIQFLAHITADWISSNFSIDSMN